MNHPKSGTKRLHECTRLANTRAHPPGYVENHLPSQRLAQHFPKNITISAAAQVKVVQGPKLATNLCLRGILQIDTIQEKGQVFAAIVQD